MTDAATVVREVSEVPSVPSSKAEEVRTLSLCSGTWPGWEELVKYPRLEHLDAVAMRPPLQTLEGALPIPSLTTLNLNDNAIEHLPEAFATCFPSLRRLDLANNRIASVDELRVLQKIPSLRVLTLHSNPLCVEDNSHCSAVWALLPMLAALDGQDKDGNAVDLEALLRNDDSVSEHAEPATKVEQHERLSSSPEQGTAAAAGAPVATKSPRSADEEHDEGKDAPPAKRVKSNDEDPSQQNSAVPSQP